MRTRGRKYQAARQQVPDRPHTIEEAVPLLQKVKYTKFDETVELAVRLGVDPKHSDQMVRGTVVLPHGLGKSKNVLVIANAEKQREALDAGADEVGGEEIVERITGRLEGLRRRRRDARHDARGRSARQGARPARADAEPEDGHGHARYRPVPSRKSRPARSSSGSTRPASCMRRSARSRSTPTASWPTPTRSWRASSRRSRRRRRAST